QIRSPVGRLCETEEHHMRVPGAGSSVVYIALLGHHVAHGSYRGNQGLLSTGARAHPGDGLSGKHPAGSLEIAGNHGAGVRGIEALRRPDSGIPELGTVEIHIPRPLHQAYEAIAALDGSLVAAFAENEDL